MDNALAGAVTLEGSIVGFGSGFLGTGAYVVGVVACAGTGQLDVAIGCGVTAFAVTYLGASYAGGSAVNTANANVIFPFFDEILP